MHWTRASIYTQLPVNCLSFRVLQRWLSQSCRGPTSGLPPQDQATAAFQVKQPGRGRGPSTHSSISCFPGKGGWAGPMAVSPR